MSRTTKALVAALALAGAAGAHAQSNLRVYGLFDVSAGRFEDAGGVEDDAVRSGNMSTSYLGFSGSEDLGGGLKAVFTLEHFLRLDSGNAGRFNGDAFWARNAFVGLESGYGTVTLGRNTTPLFVSSLLFNAFGDSFGFSPTIRQLFTPSTGLAFVGDTGWNGSVLLATKNYGGFSGNLIFNSKDGNAVGTGGNWGGNVLYFSGPFAATFAFEHVENATSFFGVPAVQTTGFDNQSTWQLGASYDLGMAKLFGQYSEVDTDAAVDTSTKLYSIGTIIPVGAGKVLAQYGEGKAEVPGATVKNKTFSLGYDYYMSKNTDLYAVYMNDKRTNVSTGNTLAGGMRLRF